MPISATQTPAPTASALDQRMNDSFFLTTDLARHSLPSYHLTISDTRDLFDTDQNKLASQSMDLRADISGNDLYLTQEVRKGEQTETHEGYIIDGGVTAIPAGKELEKQSGGLAPSAEIHTIWEELPREVGLPLFVAGAGAKAAGQEVIDGRMTDRFELDSDRAPAGTKIGLGRTVSIKKATAIVWLDRQSGALIRMTLDYEQNVLDPQTSRQVLGKSIGHMELQVTSVGAVQVALP